MGNGGTKYLNQLASWLKVRINYYKLKYLDGNINQQAYQYTALHDKEEPFPRLSSYNASN